MQHNLSVHNVYNDDIMPMWYAHDANPNDVMSGIHKLHVHAC